MYNNNKVINIINFNLIIEHFKDEEGQKVLPKEKFSFLSFFNKQKLQFKYACTNSSELIGRTNSDYYIPVWIGFYDNYSKKHYIILQENNSINIYKTKTNRDTEIAWKAIPKKMNIVDSENELLKIERSFLKLISIANTSIEKENSLKKKRIHKIDSLPNIDEIQKSAYKELTELCVFNKKSKEIILEFIETLKNYDGDDEYNTTLDYLIEFLDENDLNFIMSLDWKLGVEDFEWWLSKNLKDNHSKLNIDLPNDYDESITVSNENVFKDFNKSLRIEGLQIGFIISEFDEYIIILHKTIDKEKVKKLVNLIGREYSE